MPLLAIDKPVWQRLKLVAALTLFLLAGALAVVFWTQKSQWHYARNAEELSAVIPQIQATLVSGRLAVRELLAGTPPANAGVQHDAATVAFQNKINLLQERFGYYPDLLKASEELKDFVTGPLAELHARHFAGDSTALIEAIAHDNLHYPELKKLQEELLRKLSIEAGIAGRAELRKKQSAATMGTLGLGSAVVGLLCALVLGGRALGAAKQAGRTLRHQHQLVEEIKTLAAEGQATLDQLKTRVEPLLDSSAQVSETLTHLAAKTARIHSASTALSRFAGQHQLLSMNAAIEAEKAGEYGLAFAVIAMEIRRLSDQTTESTAEIARTLGEIQAAIKTAAGAERHAASARWDGELDRMKMNFEQIITGIDRFEKARAFDG